LAVSGSLTLGGNASSFVRCFYNNQTSSSSVVSFNGASGNQTLVLLGTCQTLGGISDATGRGVIENTETETSYPNTAVLTVDNGSNYSYNGTIRDTVSGGGKIALTKIGSGILTLSGGNIDYLGGTTIAGGKLVLQNTTAMLDRDITNNAALELDFSNDAVFSGVISGSNGSGTLTKTGEGKMTLTGTNTFQGTITIEAGTLALSTSSGQIDPAALIVNNTTFFIADSNHAIGSIIGTGTTQLSHSAQLTAPSIVQGTLTIGSSGAMAAVPEPGTFVLLALAGGLFAIYFQRKTN
jgi:autotransporter-associated beta strand protein